MRQNGHKIENWNISFSKSRRYKIFLLGIQNICRKIISHVSFSITWNILRNWESKLGSWLYLFTISNSFSLYTLWKIETSAYSRGQQLQCTADKRDCSARRRRKAAANGVDRAGSEWNFMLFNKIRLRVCWEFGLRLRVCWEWGFQFTFSFFNQYFLGSCFISLILVLRFP